MAKIVVDAKGAIVGRLATYVSKLAKSSNEVIVINCEEAVVSGNRSASIDKLKTKLQRGTAEKGPFQPKRPDRFVRKIIRGMLDYKSYKGKKDFRRIKVFMGVPTEYEKMPVSAYKLKTGADLEKNKYTTVANLCRQIGSRL